MSEVVLIHDASLLDPTAGKTQPQDIQLQSSPSTGGIPADLEFVRKKRRLERFSSSSDATPPQVSRTTSMASTGSATSYDRDPDSKMKELEATQSPTQLEATQSPTQLEAMQSPTQLEAMQSPTQLKTMQSPTQQSPTQLETMQSPTQLETDKDRSFEVDDVVKWEQPGNTYYGVIRWIGPLLDKQVAGIEMVSAN